LLETVERRGFGGGQGGSSVIVCLVRDMIGTKARRFERDVFECMQSRRHYSVAGSGHRIRGFGFKDTL
jgi:hypothetical protein